MPQRVAFLVDSPSRRAHGNAASRLALGLVEGGAVEPTLLCYSEDARPRWLPDRVPLVRLGADRATRSLPSLVRYLRAENPDVLITRQVHANFVGLAASRIAHLPPTPWKGKVVLVQDHPIQLSHAANWRDNKWLAKVCYRHADGVISPSPAVREDIIQWCRLEPSSTALVPNPIPRFAPDKSEPPHPWLRPDGPPVFVNTSNMARWKRLDILIDAFAELRQRHEARLLILGRGPCFSLAAEQIQRLHLGAHAQMLGWVDDPLEFAARACAFVLSSDEEGFAQVLTEAMSVGCPVVTTDAQGGGPRYVTDNGRYGLLVPRADSPALAQAMSSLLDPTLRAHNSQLARQRADYFSPLACATALTDFLAGRTPPG